MKVDKRFRAFLKDLDKKVAQYTYYDDETEQEVVDVSAETLYNSVMENDEWHLLGKDCVKQMCEFAVNQYDNFWQMCRNI